MTTLRLKNSVFMHIPKTGGTTVTLALSKAGMIVFDYRYMTYINNSHTYDEQMRLYDNDNIVHGLCVPYGPHTRISELLPEDKNKPKIVVIRDPLDWYKSYWAHHTKYEWSTESWLHLDGVVHVDPLYLENGGNNNFVIWLNNMLADAEIKSAGYYTRYVRSWIDDKTSIVRLPNLVDEMTAVLTKLDESLECIKYLKEIKNINALTKDLEIPPFMISKINELDSTMFKLLEQSPC